MNANHAQLCPSPEWAAHLHEDVLPFLWAHGDLSGEVLEIGPGPGAATAWLAPRVRRLVALEVDPVAAAALAGRFAGTAVEVVTGDATAVDLPEASVDAVVACTMLHHVPTAALQDRILAEAHRVLRPGGVLAGSDSLASDGLHHFHEGDTYNPVEPSALLVRLRSVGFGAVLLAVDDDLRFVATKTVPDACVGP